MKIYAIGMTMVDRDRHMAWIMSPKQEHTTSSIHSM